MLWEGGADISQYIITLTVSGTRRATAAVAAAAAAASTAEVVRCVA